MSESPTCCICQDNFCGPVVIPCGHRFCAGCVGEYWRFHRVYQCPLCKASFPTSPQLRADKSLPDKSSKDQTVPLRAGEVICDVCPEKRRAVRSCVVCLASYCDAHLQPHYQDVTLWRHQLVNVWKNLEAAVCGLHGRELTRFCRTDQTCICDGCAREDHRGHRIVAIAKEASRKKVKVETAIMRLLHAIQEKRRKVEDVRDSMTSDLKDRTTERQEETRTCSEGFVKELEQEVRALEERTSELVELSCVEDPLRFLQVFTVARTSTKIT